MQKFHCGEHRGVGGCLSSIISVHYPPGLEVSDASLNDVPVFIDESVKFFVVRGETLIAIVFYGSKDTASDVPLIGDHVLRRENPFSVQLFESLRVMGATQYGIRNKQQHPIKITNVLMGMACPLMFPRPQRGMISP